jgi:hypothetical protein
MKELKVKPIPTRNWKDKNVDLVVERDKDRKKLQESVDKRIYYMWFNYLKLCLNLEEIKYSVKKKGARGKVLGETGVKVNRKIYKDWDLNDLYTMNFKKWYKDPKHKNLFTDGGFKPLRGARYHSLVKRYNVFIEYYNGMNREFRGRGDRSQETQMCSDIFEKYQKKRFDQLKKKDPRMNVKEITPYVKDGKVVEKVYKFKSEVNTLVKKDVKICGKEILSCCQGEFPKSS